MSPPKKHRSRFWFASSVFLAVCLCVLAVLMQHDHTLPYGHQKTHPSPLTKPTPPTPLHSSGALSQKPPSDTSRPTTPPVPSEPVLAPAKPPYKPDFQLPPATQGLAPVLTHIDTQQPVVFLGIDDGAFKDQSVVTLMQQHNIKASLFLSDMFIANNPQFFTQLVAEGSTVQNHTLHHDVRMAKQSYAYQHAEICGMADTIEQYYGKRPVFFRPPGGAYSDTTRRAAYDCGMKAVVTWIAKANGGSMQYQIGNTLRPGDIVLMHFRPEFKQDLEAFIRAQDAAGLHTELLDTAISPVQ